MLDRWIAMLMLVTVLLVACAPALAQEGATPPAAAEETGATAEKDVEAGERMTLFDTINAGGVIGYIVLFLFLVAIALTIEHFLTIRRGAIMPPFLLAEVEEFFEKEEYENAMAVCEEQPTFFTNVIAAGLSRIHAGYKQMEEAMAEAGEEAATHLQQKIGYLALIANIAPMLGLLGTVAGMIKAFQQIALSAAPKPSELANSIQLALVTTFLGLMVAIPVMCVYQFFKNRVQRIVLEVGAISGELMARFRPVE
jgi:biopolymer transport protein ExbB